MASDTWVLPIISLFRRLQRITVQLLWNSKTHTVANFTFYVYLWIADYWTYLVLATTISNISCNKNATINLLSTGVVAIVKYSFVLSDYVIYGKMKHTTYARFTHSHCVWHAPRVTLICRVVITCFSHV